jgi:hypothetical protein
MELRQAFVCSLGVLMVVSVCTWRAYLPPTSPTLERGGARLQTAAHGKLVPAALLRVPGDVLFHLLDPLRIIVAPAPIAGQ